MKKLVLFFTTLISLVSISNIYSQSIPETINYQGILKDAAGVVVPNGDYNFTFKLYDVETGGTSIWSESKLITVVSGIVNTQLGSVNPIPQATFNTAAWLGITVATGIELTPRIVLTSVPYSIYSLNVPDGSITSTKIADDEVVKSLNGLKDNVNLVAGSNVTITPSGNDLTISSTGGGGGTIGGTGTANYLPLFTNSTTLGNSILYQNSNKIGINNSSPNYALSINTEPVGGLGLQLSRSNGGLGLSFLEGSEPVGQKGWFFEVYGQKLRINAAGDNGYSPIKNLMTFDREGNVGIGTETPLYPLHVATNKEHAGYFTTDSLSNDVHALHGEILGTGNTDAVGVYGKSVPADYYGYGGYFQGGFVGVRGEVQPTGGSYYSGVQGVIFTGGPGHNNGVYGNAGGGAGTNIGIYGIASGGTTAWAGYFAGNVNVTGTLSKGGGSFKIDHPLDPKNKNLYHSFVESPDMMNIYNGNVVTDASGNATITMPNWFQALNRDFRYQLTVIGEFAQAIVSKEVQNNQFAIRTDKPNVKVSWQVTGIRHDKFAEKYRIPVEENKRPEDIGKYLHPDAYGVSETMGVDYEHNKIDRDKK